MKVEIITADHPDWAATTCMIAMVYRRAYGARLTAFMPRFLKVAAPAGLMRAVVGMRCAMHQKLFLETYLDDSVENVVSAKTGEIVGRECIMEIGNLAESRHGDARSLSDLKEISCKSAWPVHISPLFWSIERLLTCKIVKI